MMDERLQDALCWAALWKRAAKYERGLKLFCRRHYARYQEYAEERIRQNDAEIERLRGALEFLEPCARELVAIAAVETEAYRRRWRMAIEQARVVVNALDDLEPDNADPR